MKFDFSTKEGTDRYFAHQYRRAAIHITLIVLLGIITYLAITC